MQDEQSYKEWYRKVFNTLHKPLKEPGIF